MVFPICFYTDKPISIKTKAIMPVSLYGQPADMNTIQEIANKHDLKVIVDGAQSFGATFKGKTDSNLGDVSTLLNPEIVEHIIDNRL